MRPSLSVATLAVSLAIGAVGTAIASPGLDNTWSLPPELLGQAAVYITTSIVMEVAFGAMFLTSAPAIVLYFLLPLGWSLLGSIPALETAARWLDSSRSMGPMTEHVLSSTERARVATTLALWLLLPLLIGIWRITHREVV